MSFSYFVTTDKKFQPRRCYRFCNLFKKAFSTFLLFIMRVNILNWHHWSYFKLRAYINAHFSYCDGGLNHNTVNMFTLLWLWSWVLRIILLLLNVVYHKMLMLKKRPSQFGLRKDKWVYRWNPRNAYILPYIFSSYALIFTGLPLSHSQDFVMTPIRIFRVLRIYIYIQQIF